MRGRASWVLFGGILLFSGVAQAQCTKDTDCKGDRICEAGKCTSPVPVTTAAPAPVVAPAPAPVVAPTPAPVVETPAAPAPAPVAAPTATEARVDSGLTPPADLAQPDEVMPAPPAATAPLGEDEPAKRRRNTPLMVTGIVMLSVTPVALLGALAARNAQVDCDRELQEQYPGHILPESERYRAERCDDYSASVYVLGIGGAVLGAVGIPLIFYGGAKVENPKPRAVELTPWATPRAGGVQLRLAL